MRARPLLLAAAVAMAAVEIVAAFVETAGALGLAAIFALLALWLWRRESLWSVALLGVFFALELIYLADYDWNDNVDRTMIVATVAVAGAGLAAVTYWLVQRRSRRSAAG